MRLTNFIFSTPEVHKIINSLSFLCFTIKTIIEIKKDKGTNFGAIPNMFKNEYKKYVGTGYPLSTTSSKKFTALTVSAINERPRIIKKNVLRISKK